MQKHGLLKYLSYLPVIKFFLWNLFHTLVIAAIVLFHNGVCVVFSTEMHCLEIFIVYRRNVFFCSENVKTSWSLLISETNTGKQ